MSAPVKTWLAGVTAPGRAILYVTGLGELSGGSTTIFAALADRFTRPEARRVARAMHKKLHAAAPWVPCIQPESAAFKDGGRKCILLKPTV